MGCRARRRRAVAAVAVVTAGLLAALSACGSGGPVRARDQSSGQPLLGAHAARVNTGRPEVDRLLTSAMATYQQYVLGELQQLRTQTSRFTDAVRVGLDDQARQLYAPSRMHWERIEPIADLVGDSDAAIDSTAADHHGNVNDPKFTGWHRLEYLLFARNTTRGGEVFANQLDTEVAALDGKLRAASIPPTAAADGAVAMIRSILSDKLDGQEEVYSHTDLWDVEANLEGSDEVLQAFAPALKVLGPALLTRLSTEFTTARNLMSLYAGPDGRYLPFQKLTASDSSRIRTDLTRLESDLAHLPATLSLS